MIGSYVTTIIKGQTTGAVLAEWDTYGLTSPKLYFGTFGLGCEGTIESPSPTVSYTKHGIDDMGHYDCESDSAFAPTAFIQFKQYGIDNKLQVVAGVQACDNATGGGFSGGSATINTDISPVFVDTPCDSGFLGYVLPDEITGTLSWSAAYGSYGGVHFDGECTGTMDIAIDFSDWIERAFPAP